MTPTLVAELVARCPYEPLEVSAAEDGTVELVDAFELGDDMDASFHLTADGRLFLVEGFSDPPTVREQQGTDGATSLVIAAKRTGIAALVDLIPPRPADAATCAACRGTHWAPWFPLSDQIVVCVACVGVGWVRVPP